MSDQCSICLESLNSEKEVSETACKHTYHSSCIESSLRYSDSCPLCRRKATPPLCSSGRMTLNTFSSSSTFSVF
ncbi:hypothetical protein ACLB2K_051380 [Fragaria x ananassa]